MCEVARMDEANRALCYAYRNPPPGKKKLALTKIRSLVWKTNKRHPSLSAINEAAKNFKKEKGSVGRPAGSRNTTAAEDRELMQTFKTMRPDGHYVDSRIVHKALPKKIKKKIGRRTVVRRLAEKGYHPERKIQRTDTSVVLSKKRSVFADKHKDKSGENWKTELQGCGDIKEFTYYPQELQPRFKRLRAPWTYMTKAEKTKPKFLRPKKWFQKKDWKKTKKQRVFGLTTSNGHKLNFFVPKPWSTEEWAVALKNKVVPFLKKAFPNRTSFQILLDGEKLLHGPAAKTVMRENGVKTLAGWPGYSPDLNPQENLWAWAEEHLRTLEKDNDTFEAWKKKVLKACDDYPSAKKLIGSMAKRMQKVLTMKGGMTGK